MCLIVVVFINMLGAGAYGEAEFIFASIKVITITGLIVSLNIYTCIVAFTETFLDPRYRY